MDELVRVAYDELRAIAAAMRRADPFAVLSTRTIVHEAWMRLAASPSFRYESRAHLRNIIIRKMRHVLVDSARMRRAAKRDGIVITADSSIPMPADPADRVLAIDQSIRKLEELDTEQAAIVEAHFFGGLSFAEIAEDTGLSESTVRRRWQAAKRLLEAWLREAV